MWRALYLFFFGDTVAALSRDSWISARQQGNQQAVTTGTDALLPPHLKSQSTLLRRSSSLAKKALRIFGLLS